MTLFFLSYGLSVVPLIITVCALSRAIDAALRIFGGRVAKPGEYPYVVKIQVEIMVSVDAFYKNFVHLCTGSVLTPVWTLSSGHCVTLDSFTTILQDRMPGVNLKYVIRYEDEADSCTPTANISEIIGSVLHPAFKFLKTQSGDLVANDVGLLKTMPIKLRQYAKLSAVEYPSLTGQAAAAVGYGRSHDEHVMSTTIGETLRALDVIIKPCDKYIVSKVTLTAVICLCRKSNEFPVSICAGDSGGPLIHHSGVVGLNQMGAAKDCSLRYARAGFSSDLVGIIGPISPFLEWISDQINYEV